MLWIIGGTVAGRDCVTDRIEFDSLSTGQDSFKGVKWDSIPQYLLSEKEYFYSMKKQFIVPAEEKGHND